ncbi:MULTISPECIES: hypothetical protein [Gulbenkiania]|uniref:Chemotaxis protein n=1 Tax=Gulbenkiania indica TaxID=375574 RepID=A0A0K6H811_9NEIS|nr:MULTISPECIES: hypothetical protein [Gulbenkiania]CUA86898.1 hypothetical protein Ga0061063_0006 [Gulbenkiania indica]
MSSSSTLDYSGEERPITTRGHGVEALGPSDSSDSASDVVGGPGTHAELAIPLDTGTLSDPDGGETAAPDIGDADLSSDSDRYGTGERAAVGRDASARDGGDLMPDHIEGPAIDGEEDLTVGSEDDLADVEVASDLMPDGGPVGRDEANREGAPEIGDDDDVAEDDVAEGDDLRGVSDRD